jgi:hypothetical protein
MEWGDNICFLKTLWGLGRKFQAKSQGFGWRLGWWITQIGNIVEVKICFFII